jgi:hypothetical protein
VNGPVEGVVVCGAGAAGMAAAIAAARAGVRVWLLEDRPHPGGTVAHSLIHTLGGFFDSRGELLNGGLPQELVEKLQRADLATRRRRMGRCHVLSVCPDVYQQVVHGWLAREPRLTLLCETRVQGVIKEVDRVIAVEVMGPEGSTTLPARAVIDATGTAALVRLIDEALIQEETERAAGGLIFTLRGVTPGAVAFPKGLGVVRALRSAFENGTLPAGCANAWVDAGVVEDEVYVKLLVPVPPGELPREDFLGRAFEAKDAVIAFLKRQPEFSGAWVCRTGTLGVRDGGRVCGEYCLTVEDVRAGRKFEDAAARCCWPIEYWDAGRGVSLEYLADGDYYEVPMRSLRLQGYRNVWIAGKCLSADRQAQASARVVGSCWAMGEAAGRAAAALGRDGQC